MNKHFIFIRMVKSFFLKKLSNGLKLSEIRTLLQLKTSESFILDGFPISPNDESKYKLEELVYNKKEIHLSTSKGVKKNGKKIGKMKISI
jgi:hypothetical protein